MIHNFLCFDCIMRLTPLDFVKVKWLNSDTFMSYVDARTWVKFIGSMFANYLDKEQEENSYSTFLGGWLTFSVFLGG